MQKLTSKFSTISKRHFRIEKSLRTTTRRIGENIQHQKFQTPPNLERTIRIIRATNSPVPDLQAGNDLLSVGASMHHRRKHFEMLRCNKQNATEHTHETRKGTGRDETLLSLFMAMFIFISARFGFNRTVVSKSSYFRFVQNSKLDT